MVGWRGRGVVGWGGKNVVGWGGQSVDGSGRKESGQVRGKKLLKIGVGSDSLFVDDKIIACQLLLAPPATKEIFSFFNTFMNLSTLT